MKTLMHGGQTRQYKVHVPPSYDAKSRTPLVVNIHGLISDGTQQETISEMTPKANAEGFIVVYPFGLGNSWNAGSCCGSSSSGMVDDVGFLRAMLDALEMDLCIDRKRIFATGLSNGGYMSHRLACELGARIAAIAPVAGAMAVTTCNPGRKVPVLHFHGTSDTLVSYSSGQSAVMGWVTRNACGSTPMMTYQKGDSTCQTYACGGPEVTFCTIDAGGHTWPGATVFPLPTGKTTLDINATNHMWDFFKRHPLP